MYTSIMNKTSYYNSLLIRFTRLQYFQSISIKNEFKFENSSENIIKFFLKMFYQNFLHQNKVNYKILFSII